MMGALRDRVMLPDGRLTKWRSPAGTPLEFAALAPVIPWSDLISAAAPNGTVSDTGVTSRKKATSPVGVAKLTFVSAIFAATQAATGPGQPLGQPFVPGPADGVPGAARARSRGRRRALGRPDRSRRALQRRDRARNRRDPDPFPLGLLHKGGSAAAAAADLFGLHRRSVPGRRSPALRQPHPQALSRARRCGCCSATSVISARPTSSPSASTCCGRSEPGSTVTCAAGGKPGRNGVAAYIQTCPRSRDGLGPLRAPSFGALSKGNAAQELRRGKQRSAR